MRLLLDTCALLWFVEGSDKMSTRARELVEDATNDVAVSLVSFWEITIKFHKGTLALPMTPPSWFAAAVDPYAFRVLGVERRDIEALHALGPPVAHRDPFDRLLLATALQRGLTFVTPDEHLNEYRVAMAW